MLFSPLFFCGSGIRPVLQRRDAIFFLEYILKICLAGKAEVAADLTQRFIGVGQQALCFFQLAAHDKAADIKPQFFFEAARDIGTALPDKVRHVVYPQWLVGALGDELHTVKHFL